MFKQEQSDIYMEMIKSLTKNIASLTEIIEVQGQLIKNLSTTQHIEPFKFTPPWDDVIKKDES